MADPPSFFSVRNILENSDYVANLLTTIAVAGSFSVLVSLHNKLTGAAIFISFFASSLFAVVGWPLLLQYGYGGLGPSLMLAVICGVGGMLILATLISILRRWYARSDAIADEIALRVGIDKPTQPVEDRPTP